MVVVGWAATDVAIGEVVASDVLFGLLTDADDDDDGGEHDWTAKEANRFCNWAGQTALHNVRIYVPNDRNCIVSFHNAGIILNISTIDCAQTLHICWMLNIHILKCSMEHIKFKVGLKY